MPWQQLTIHTSEHYAEGLSDLLESTGALAVTLSDAADQPLFEPPLGTTPLWQQTIVVGLYNVDWQPQQTLDAIIDHYAPNPAPRHSISLLADQDWQRACLDRFHPMQYGQRLWICPSWHTPPEPNAVTVMLDPGLAFGTGTHPTTALCLEWLDQNIKAGDTVIDYGCGSGILAVAAAKLGSANVQAIDIDPQAITATTLNAEKNQVANSIATTQNDTMLNRPVDVLVANILAQPLISLAENLTALVKKNGQIVLSGILQDQAKQVIDRYKNWFDLNPQTDCDGWVRLDGRKR